MFKALFFIISYIDCLTVANLSVWENKKVIGDGIDYSVIVREAELQKMNLLNYLNKSATQNIYKDLYKMLLSNLVEEQEKNPLRISQIDFILQVDTNTRRIVAGHNTSISAVPWQVSLRDKAYPACGGSIATELWIITAAHCLLRAQAKDLTVRLGSSWKTHGGEMYDVMASYVHPRYVSKTKVYDVGLIRLFTPLRFSSRILPIRVIERSTRLHANQTAIVSGWGRLTEGGTSPRYLQATTVRAIPMKLCRQSGLDRRSIHPESMFCAGYFSQNSPDACQGDSGGPIVSEGVLIGVVSWGLGCARGNFPGVYTRLADPTIWDWINSHISKSINESSNNL